MATDFALLRKFKDGVDIRPILKQRRDAGANGVRVLGAKAASDNPNIPSLFVLDPREPGIYEAMDGLFTLLRQEGLTCEFTIGADEQIFRRPLAEQQAHFDRVYDVIWTHHAHVVVEAWNEVDKNLWGATPQDFRQPTGILWSRGSNIEEGEPALPAGTHTTYHNGRNAEWPRKFKSDLELADRYSVPCIGNEPQRCSGNAWPVSDWFEAGTCAGMFGGATFHSDEGRTSDLWPPATLERATAFYAGMACLPADVCTWGYAVALGGIGVQTYDELRTYGMIRGGEQWVIVLRPGPGYPMQAGLIAPTAARGWTIAEQRGPRGTVLRLTR
jgi:hypothetical protein